MMNTKTVIKNVSYSFIANFISLLLGILATFLFPKFLNVSGYGYYQLYIFYTGYLIITALGISDGVQLRIAGKRYTDLNYEEQSSIFWLSTLSQFVIYIILLFLVLFTATDSNKKFALISACIVGLVTHPRYYLYTLLQSVNRLKEYAHIIITERSISIVISIVALFWGYKDFRLMIVFDVIGRILSFLLAVFFCKEIVLKKPRINRSTFKIAFQYTFSGIMILISTQASSIVIGVNRYGIEHCWGIETFGKISLAIALSNMVLRCVNSISVVMFPTLRNVEKKKLPVIYETTNSFLMAFIFVGMCLFEPACRLVSIWLPQYADSLKYSLLLLPVCIYECKYSMLINTNLKNLNREKAIGLINLISVIISFLTAYVGITLFGNMEIAILGMIIALSVRSVIGEIIIANEFNIKIMKNVFFEFLISVVFIICYFYKSSLLSSLIFIFLVMIYLIFERKGLTKFINLIKAKT